MRSFEEVIRGLSTRPRRFVITGAAGFIGSHLTEQLLRLGQTVVGLDNFATGSRRNLAETLDELPADARARFRFIEGDIRSTDTCAEALGGAEIVLHQAALGSVPRSIEEPLATHSANVDGFVNVLLAAHAAGVRRVVYASSSSVYGDDPSLPKIESRTGRPLSPYAATKLIDEVYAATFQRSHGIRSIGLRYFNVFGPRQDPAGPYAAVIPRWIENLLKGEPCVVFGDGTASRDFCFVENVVRANLLAACATDDIEHDVFNIACAERTSLRDLFVEMRSGASRYRPSAAQAELQSAPPRAGDVAHSLASIDRAREILGYEPAVAVAHGIVQTIAWHAARLGRVPSPSEDHPASGGSLTQGHTLSFAAKST